MFYDDDLGIENIFFPVCLISEYASFTINVYLYSIHLGIWNVTAVFQFPFKVAFGIEIIVLSRAMNFGTTGHILDDRKVTLFAWQLYL